MNKKIIELISTTSGQLIFSILAGLGYFMLLCGPIIEMSRGMWFILICVAPMIIFGAALVIIKMIKQARENGNTKTILRIFWLHTVIFVMGIVFIAAMF